MDRGLRPRSAHSASSLGAQQSPHPQGRLRLARSEETSPPPAALARRGRAFGRADRAERAARDGWRRSALSAADAAASSRGGDAVATAPPRAFPRGSRASRKTFRKRVALFSFSPTRRRSFSRPETHLGVGVLGEAGIEDTVGDLSGRVWRMRRQRSVRDASRGSRGTRHFGVAAARFSRSRLAKKRRSALKESARIDKSRSRTWSASLSG